MISAIATPPCYRSFPTISYNIDYVTLSRDGFLFNNGQFRKEILRGGRAPVPAGKEAEEVVEDFETQIFSSVVYAAERVGKPASPRSGMKRGYV